jgi:hypothetical protein
MSIVPWKNEGLQQTAVAEPTIGERVRVGEQLAQEAWRQVVIASKAYCQALDLTEKDLEAMEHHQAHVVVMLVDDRQVNLVPKRTCGAPYGDTWVMLLQARLEGAEVKGIGGGTTFITALSADDHQQVVQAIARRATRIAKGRIWP